jgi:hydroxyethylthiazole kinase-like uncharacterized protein yjeF
MIKIVANKEMHDLDAYTINEVGIPGVVLMENAGRAVFNAALDLYQKQPAQGLITIFCGKGNNGGDGYVIARYFYTAGYSVQIIAIADPESLQGDALTNYKICRKLAVPVNYIATLKQLNKQPQPALIIDALLGTGIKGPASGFTAEVIDYINASGAAVVAVDIPSGLSGDYASIPGPAIRAQLTVTMALPKRAHLFEPARSLVGKLVIADIGIPFDQKRFAKIGLNYINQQDITLPQTAGNENKYSAGKLFILAGSPGMTGAAVLAAQGALRIGTGLIMIGIPQSLNTTMEVKITEALTHPLPETSAGTLSVKGLSDISERIAWADTVLIGPGIGRNAETVQLVSQVCQMCNNANKPTVLDADGLFALSTLPELPSQLKACFLLTPHHGEFMRLSGYTKAAMAREPWRCVQAYLKDKSFIINLKGAPSLVANPEGSCFVNSTGNPTLAKGGSGDVLAGVCAGLMTRGLSPLQAAISGNYMHGLAADYMADAIGMIPALPGDLQQFLPQAIKSVTDGKNV